MDADMEKTAGMLFTGERFIPGIEDEKLTAEHLERYLALKPLVSGKRVADVACGEGYGSRIIADWALEVTGVDIDAAAIENARKKYGGTPNLQYRCGNAALLDMFADHSVDVLVSFETIEHITEEMQKAFLEESVRILKEDGLLVMSTPNKAVYSDLYHYQNKYHIKEFYRQEFLDFLGSKFQYIKIYRQYQEVATCIEGDDAKKKYTRFYIRETPPRDEKFIIALASNREITGKMNRAFIISEKPVYENLNRRIVQLQEEEEERNLHIARLDAELTEKGSCIRELQKTIDTLQTAHEHLLADNDALHSDILKLQQEVLNKKGHIELLLPAERELIAIKNSRMFKIMRFFCRGLDGLIFIPGFLARQIAAFIRMMGHVNAAELKIAWGYVRKEGIPGAYHHLMRDYHQGMEKKLPLEVEKRVYTPITDLSICARLTLPKTDAPEVSIIIPAYNQFTYTYYCLKSIIENSGDVPYEVILADDCSNDLTVSIADVVDNLIIARTEKNLRFLRNCNHAARYARGKYILFLNNDTQVQENWLSPLVDLMERDEKIGLTGSKLVYSDGTLQEAGGIIWRDASGWNYGRNDNALKPEYNYVKETDYISGASVMIRRSLWEKLGGFDELFAPAYYEDSDLAFQVRAAGYQVVYQPLSVVVHFEGKSNGTDLSSGIKQYQVENNVKFRNKWREVLEKEHLPNGQDVYLAKDRSQLKKRILVVDHYVPHYDKDAGGRCTYMYLKLFVKFGFKVTFIGDNFYPHEPYTTELKQMGIEVLYGDYYYLNWQEWLKENLHYFDYIYLQRPHISIKYIDLVKQYGRGKIFYFAHDLHFLRLTREYELKHDPEILAQAEKFKKDEFYLFRQADVVHVVGSYEQAVLQKELPGKTVRNIPLYIYEKLPEDINKDFSTRRDIVFVGGFGHTPNIDAVTWFAGEIFPDILKAYPDMIWHIVGGNPPDAVKALASENIVPEGFLSDEDLEKMYRSCRLAVVPLRVGAGVKGKVVEAAYYQIPLVTTSIGEEGISTEEGAFLAEDDAGKMAQLIISLYMDFDRLKQMSDAGAALIRNHYMLDEAERVLRLDL